MTVSKSIFKSMSNAIDYYLNSKNAINSVSSVMVQRLFGLHTVDVKSNPIRFLLIFVSFSVFVFILFTSYIFYLFYFPLFS